MSDLWAGMRIPIILVSGAVNSGKTLFGFTIDPNCRKSAADVQPTTITWDQEGSADSYVGGLNFEHKDTRAAVAAGAHLKTEPAGPTDPRWRKILLETADVNDSPAASMFRAWYLSLLRVPAGRYAVGICDTFTPLQDGLVEWLRRHPEAFGRSPAQYDKAASMFLWPDIKSVLSHILATDCRTRFESFILNVHLKNEWAGGAKTGRLVAEGLDVLEKLATLHIELDRTPKDKGKEAPRVPSGLVKKERLVRFGPGPDGDQPILPPRLAHCTPDAIRQYITSPPDFANLKAGERLPDQSLSDDEKLRLSASKAENERAAAEAHLSALELARRAVEQKIGGPVTLPQVDLDPKPPTSLGPITAQQTTELIGLLREQFATGLAARAWLAEQVGTEDPGTLTESAAAGVLSSLYAMKHRQQQARIQTPAPSTPEPPIPAQVTPEQRAELRRLCEALYGESAAAEQTKWLADLGINSNLSLTFGQAGARIVQLADMLTARQATESPPTQHGGDEIPF